nr:hypothetical protein [Bacteroidota bacterium]
EVTDNGSLTDTAYFKMIIDARCDLTLIIKDLMTDDLLTGQSEFIIGSNNYTSFTGDVTQQINPGTYEIFATNPATIDWTFIWQAYGFIQEAGVFNNVEQRAGPDQTSQVSFDKQDRTLTIYKLMSDFDLYTVQLAIATGPDGETIRFGQQSPDAWFNLNYQTPNSTTVSRVQDLLYNHMPAATNNKLTMTYIEGTVTPAEPYLEMAMDPSFPGPGTNSTSWNANYEITTCSARWPGDQSTSTLWTEMIQAIQNQNDVGISLTFYDGSNWHISDFGKACLKLGYNVDPGTLLYDNSDKSGKNVIDDKKKQLGIFEESSSTGNVEFNYINK